EGANKSGMSQLRDEPIVENFKHLFRVQTRLGKEKDSIACIEENAKKEQLPVEAFALPFDANHIYICANHIDIARCVCTGYYNIFLLRLYPVAKENIPAVLTAMKKARRLLPAITSAWVTVKDETSIYNGDFAAVLCTSPESVEVACVPRIPHPWFAREEERQRRPPPQIIKINDIPSLHRETLETDGNLVATFKWEGRTYNNGLEAWKQPMVRYVSNLTLRTGDRVELLGAGFLHQYGKIAKTEQDTFSVDIFTYNDREESYTTNVMVDWNELRQAFCNGDHVVVYAGRHKSRRGMVSEVAEDTVTLIAENKESVCEDKNYPEMIASLVQLGMRDEPPRESTPMPKFNSTLEEVDPAWDPTHTLLDHENETPIDSPPAETAHPARERSETSKWLFQPEVCKHMATHQFTLSFFNSFEYKMGHWEKQNRQTTSKKGEPGDCDYVSIDLEWSGDKGAMCGMNREKVPMRVLAHQPPVVGGLRVVFGEKHVGKLVRIEKNLRGDQKHISIVHEVDGDPDIKWKILKQFLCRVDEWGKK
ncbi:hypothetical protein BD410DRAFT_809972, partial [Rickenella mellea]